MTQAPLSALRDDAAAAAAAAAQHHSRAGERGRRKGPKALEAALAGGWLPAVFRVRGLRFSRLEKDLFCVSLSAGASQRQQQQIGHDRGRRRRRQGGQQPPRGGVRLGTAGEISPH